LLQRKDKQSMKQTTPPSGQVEAPELQPTFGRYAEIPYDQMTPEQQEGYQALVEIVGSEPSEPDVPLSGPLRIWVHNPELSKAVAPFVAHFHPSHYSLSEREREIAVCTINSKWHAAFSTDIHTQRAEKLGLPADMIDALVCGLSASFSDEREQVIYEMATTLANSRWIPQGLYDRAVKALGHVGITDVIALMGEYTAISLTLAFYDVPVGAPGMKR
jgi:4-carboxymuconolactone decarboxylase